MTFAGRCVSSSVCPLGKFATETRWAYLFSGKFAGRGVSSSVCVSSWEICERSSLGLSLSGKSAGQGAGSLVCLSLFWGNFGENLVGPTCFRGNLQGEASEAQRLIVFVRKFATETRWAYLFSGKCAGRGVEASVPIFFLEKCVTETRWVYLFSGKVAGRSVAS